MKEILNLGNIPLVNNLFNSSQEALKAKRFPLRVVEENDLIMKLDLEIESSEMFSTYLYRSAVNAPYRDHCKKMWTELEKYNPKRIVDIGGNDGTLLEAFRSVSKKNLELINIDASESFVEDNRNKNIIYHNNFWGDLILEHKADLITSTNVFQHNPDYKKFLNGIKNNLNGIWVLEFPYFLETVKTNQFDQIYHEHVYYWLVTPLVKLFREYGLKIIDISKQEIHGGSLRVISSNRENDIENQKIINKYLEIEQSFDFNNWKYEIFKKINEDRKFIENLSGDVAVFGAAAKGCVYLNALGIQDKIKYIVDDTIQKQGKYSPGSELKIVHRDVLHKDKPKYLIILAHNFADYISKSLKSEGYKGIILTMLPTIKYL